MKKTDNPISRAIELAGGVASLAQKCHVTRAAVYQWKENGVSPERAVHIERVLGGAVSRRELCPNVFE